MADIRADVVVVGYGGGGSMAAIAAHDAGADVLLLEKMATPGGSTAEAGGSLRPPVDWRLAAQHYAALSLGTTPLDVMETFARAEADIATRIAELGGTTATQTLPKAPFPARHQGTAYAGIVGAEGLGQRVQVQGKPGQQGGEVLFELLSGHVERRGIKVLCDSPAVRLVRSPSGTVSGVEVGGDTPGLVEANGGVVLTCGGFGHDSALKKEYFGADIGVLSPPGRATGDGIRMAQAVGADLWHMNSVSCTFGFRFPGHVSGFYAQMPAVGFFIVDQNGRRFCNETSIENHSAFSVLATPDPVRGLFERIPAFVIFDEATRLAGPIFNNSVGENRHFVWSDDNGAEVDQGWIAKDATIAGLARQLGLPVDEVERTYAVYDRCAESGGDLLGRPNERMNPMEPPFYGVALWPCLLNTQGGPRRNGRAEVVDVFGDAIPGLYSAGELGSIWGRLYPGSGNVAEALIFGEIAGQNAAAR